MSSARGKVRRLSRHMEWLATGLAGLVGAGVLYALGLAYFDPRRLTDTAMAQFGSQAAVAPAMPSGATVGLLGLMILAQAGLMIWALLMLRRAFREIAAGEVVGIAAARSMRLAGIAFLVNSIAMVLWWPLASLALSIDMPVGHRFLALNIGTPELMALLVSGVLIVFGHLIAVAADIEDENRRFV